MLMNFRSVTLIFIKNRLKSNQLAAQSRIPKKDPFFVSKKELRKTNRQNRRRRGIKRRDRGEGEPTFRSRAART